MRKIKNISGLEERENEALSGDFKNGKIEINTPIIHLPKLKLSNPW